MIRHLFLWVILLVACASMLPPPAFASNGNTYALPKQKLPRFDEADIDMRIDGQLTEAVWAEVPYYNNYHIIEPETIDQAPMETRVRLFYTSKGLYVGVWAEQPLDTLVERLTPRDQFIRRDRTGITLDPSGEGLYGYWFDVHLGGTFSDGTVLPERQFSREWDGAWYGGSGRHDKGYAAEFFLPWSMMALPEVDGPTRTIGFYTSRSVAHRGELWAWPALPRSTGRFMSVMQQFEIDNFKPSRQFTFYPYASTAYDVLAEEDAYKAGFDLFWRPTPNLQLTSTFNPDFGNVESDDVIVNLTSIEAFFPEKRPFFLEGQNIFNTSPRARRQGRGTPTTLIYTRRIGGPPEPIAGLDLSDQEEAQPTELEAAVKVTGQVDNLRYGVLAAVEDDTLLNGEINDTPAALVQEGRDFGAARFLYETTAGGGRRGLGWISTMVDHAQGDAIVHGIDGHLLTADGNWQVDGQLLYSDVDDVTGHGAFLDAKYQPRRGVQHSFALDYFDEDLEINDFGFMRRNDAIAARYRLNLTEAGLENVKLRKTSLFLSQEYNNAGRVVRSGMFFNQEREFHNNHTLFTEVNYFPTRWDDLNSEGNGSYKIEPRWQFGAFYGTDESKPLQLGAGYFRLGEDLGGRQNVWELEANWRPSDRFSLSMFSRYRDRDGWLIHWNERDFVTLEAEFWQPRLEMTYFFTARQQLRVTAQWAGINADEIERWEVPLGDGKLIPDANPADGGRDFTISRLTFQARYRWELAPLSDLFVVYTRGSDLDTDNDANFNTLLRRSWTDRALDIFVIKLRYRLGS